MEFERGGHEDTDGLNRVKKLDNVSCRPCYMTHSWNISSAWMNTKLYSLNHQYKGVVLEHMWIFNKKLKVQANGHTLKLTSIPKVHFIMKSSIAVLVSLTWTPECGVSDAGILSSGEKECGKLIWKKDQPHCPQTAGKKQMTEIRCAHDLLTGGSC